MGIWAGKQSAGGGRIQESVDTAKNEGKRRKRGGNQKTPPHEVFGDGRSASTTQRIQPLSGKHAVGVWEAASGLESLRATSRSRMSVDCREDGLGVNLPQWTKKFIGEDGYERNHWESGLLDATV